MIAGPSQASQSSGHLKTLHATLLFARQCRQTMSEAPIKRSSVLCLRRSPFRAFANVV